MSKSHLSESYCLSLRTGCLFLMVAQMAWGCMSIVASGLELLRLKDFQSNTIDGDLARSGMCVFITAGIATLLVGSCGYIGVLKNKVDILLAYLILDGMAVLISIAAVVIVFKIGETLQAIQIIASALFQASFSYFISQYRRMILIDGDICTSKIPPLQPNI
ncbi:hypothetical protein K7432_009405 [Basidiobolus ranarum]|uniref:Uncharacterized protein n=1 Tax=Basidiobolus ranarum TaxID=34480 RepID=A0ABR2WQB6_9FUNG